MMIRNTMATRLLTAAVLAFGTANAANAATYSVGSDFNSGVFTLGYGNTNTLAFFPVTPSPCFTILSCYQEPGGNGSFLANLSKTDNSPFNGELPAGKIWLHPFSNTGPEFAPLTHKYDAIIRFTAPKSDTWRVTGHVSPGFQATQYAFGIFGKDLVGDPYAAGGYYWSVGFNGANRNIGPFDFKLSAGDSIYFSSFYTGCPTCNFEMVSFDAQITGLSGAVPEPTSWAMLITGFGLVGGMARRRRIGVAVPA